MGTASNTSSETAPDAAAAKGRRTAALDGQRRRLILGLVLVLVVALGGAAVTVASHPGSPESTPVELPLRAVGELLLPGDSSRFDYASLDAERGLLFIAHLGASEIIEVDVRTGRVVRTIAGINNVHGVLVVPERHRLYATATGDNSMLSLDEDTGQVLTRTPTGAYPDGIAYDPVRGTVWTTNESGGSETVIDAASGQLLGTVDLGGDAGNVAYDPVADQILADNQGSDELIVIDPDSLAIDRRVALPGCDHPHGLALASGDRLAFVACDANAVLLTVDLTTWQVVDTDAVGSAPDVLAYDPGLHRLYVAAESGPLTILDHIGGQLTVTGRDRIADGAHVVAIDPTNHRTYYPIPHGSGDRPSLLTFEPST